MSGAFRLTRSSGATIMQTMTSPRRVLRLLAQIALALIVLVTISQVAAGQARGTNRPLGLLMVGIGIYQLLGAFRVVPLFIGGADKRQAILVGIVPIALGVFLYVS